MIIRRVRTDLSLLVDEQAPTCGEHRPGAALLLCALPPDHVIRWAKDVDRPEGARDDQGALDFHVAVSRSGVHYYDWDAA